MTTDATIETTPAAAGVRRRRRPRDQAAGRVLVTMLVCLLVWTFLYAPELQRASEAQPEGTRRSVSLAVLGPVVWLSDTIGLSGATDGATRALGRDPDDAVGGSVGDIPVEVDDIPTVAPGTQPPGTGKPGGDGGKEEPTTTQLRVPTAEDKLRVAVVGDSLAAGVGYFAERVFKPFFVDVLKQGQISTGLARPDYFNWMANMQLIVRRYRPDLTVVMIGENDNQTLKAPGGATDTPIGTFDWRNAYEQRVRRFAKIATSKGGHVVWVGLPIERDTQRWMLIERQNDVFRAVAAKLPNVVYLDTWELFAKSDGSYTAYYRDGNQVKLVREGDGIHFNADGYTILMEKVAEAARQAFGLDPKTFDI